MRKIPTLYLRDRATGYVTGDVTPEYLDAIERAREGKASSGRADDGDSRQLHLSLKSAG